MTIQVAPMPEAEAQARKGELNIYQRMHAVMTAITYIQKEKKPEMKYSIVTHDAVTAKVRPELVKMGIIYWPEHITLEQQGNRTQVTMIVRFQNIDDDDDYLLVHSAGFGIDNQDKGPGKAISYAVKYALLKALGLESGDDPDLDQTTEWQPAPLVARSEVSDLMADIEAIRTLEDYNAVVANLTDAKPRLGLDDIQLLSGLVKQKRSLVGLPPLPQKA